MKIGLIGCGNIGSSVAEEILNGRFPGLSLEKILIKDLKKSNRNSKIPAALFTDRPSDVVENSEINLIIEVTGMENPILEYVLTSIKNKKHFVTANKELIAKHLPIISKTASENNVQIGLDATVGGGIPIINVLSERSDHIQSVIGILNGTTNYILSQMAEGLDFKLALSQAQELGFAEPDSSNDLKGIDAKYKIAILASLAFGQYIHPDLISCKGIESIASIDFSFAKDLGFNIKLLGIANNQEISVYPSLIDNKLPLAHINGVLNAAQISSDLTGTLTLSGAGAGAKPTTSSIMSDVIAIQKGRLREFCLQTNFNETNKQNEDIQASFYLGLKVQDKLGVIKTLAEIFENQNISLESLSQRTMEEEDLAELIVLTHEISSSSWEDAVKKIQALDCVKEIGCILKVFKS